MRLASIFSWFEPSWIPSLPTKADVAYHLGIGGLTWYGVTAHVAPWISLIAFGIAVVCAVASMILAKLPVPTPQTTAAKLTTKLIAIVSGVVAIAFFGIYFSALQHQAQAYSALNTKVLTLEHDLGCLDRPDTNEQNLFDCIPAMQRDAETAKAAAVEQQQTIDQQAQADLQAQLDALQASAATDKAWIAAHQKDDGPVPQILKDYGQYLRDREGSK
jgi:hypothetical protein